VAGALVGNYYITPTATAIIRAWRLCQGRVREYQLIRRHALKLAFWPKGEDPRGQPIVDLDWDWVKGLERLRIGELRIDDQIAGQRNIRIIFFKAKKMLPDDPLPRIWPLTVFVKKRMDFSKKEIAAWRAMRNIVVIRRYDGDPDA